MNKATFDAIRPIFGGSLSQPQIDGIEAINKAWSKYGDGNVRHLAYLLATAKHETAHTMQPIYERGPKAYFDKYNAGTKIGKALGNTLAGDGYKFRGRGYVQLTGRANYAKAGRKLGIDLVANPDAALLPEVAARILIAGCLEGWFTGKKLSDYVDYISMRRVVNGTDKASLIAAYAEKFEAALRLDGSVAQAPTKPITLEPAPHLPPEPIIVHDEEAITTTPASRPNMTGFIIGAIVFAAIALYVLTQVKF
jgi:hypothetical protein